MKFIFPTIVGVAALAMAFSAVGIQAQDVKEEAPAKPTKIAPGSPRAGELVRNGEAKRPAVIPGKKVINPEEERNKPVASSPTITIAGVFVDADGKPVAGVELSPYFNAYSGERLASLKATSDENGKFSLEMNDTKRRQALYATNNKGLGAVVYEEVGSHDNLKIVLQKERSCWINLRNIGDTTLPAGGTVTITPLDEKGVRMPNRVLFYGSTIPGMSFNIVPGAYELGFRVQNRQPMAMRVDVKAGTGIQDLGTAEFDQTIIQKHMNKAAPALSATAVRKLGTEIKEGTMLSLDDYKGKWVVVEFWGFW